MLLFFDWFPNTPALLNIMSTCPYRQTVDLTKFSTSSSTLTSQCTYVAEGAKVSASIVPSASSTSAITTLAPFFTNTRTVASPIPLAPPVTIATLPSNLNITSNSLHSYQLFLHKFDKFKSFFISRYILPIIKSKLFLNLKENYVRILQISQQSILTAMIIQKRKIPWSLWLVISFRDVKFTMSRAIKLVNKMFIAGKLK